MTSLSVDNASGQSASPQRGLLARHPLISFFVMAYAFSWIAWSPWVLSEDGAGLLPYELSGATTGLLNAAAILLGPTLSAFIMTGIIEGRAGIRRLLRRIVLWRVGLRWYLFALVGIPVVMALGTVILPGGLAALLALLGPGYVLSYLGTFVLVTILGGPLFEEPGWRGFALPRLQPLYGPLVGTLILGLLWALWHLPQFLVPSWAEASGGSGFLAIVKFVLIAIAFAIVTTWVFNNTKGSVFMAILVHASIDTFSLPIGSTHRRPCLPFGRGQQHSTELWGVCSDARGLDPRPVGLPTLPARRTLSSYSSNSRMSFREDIFYSVLQCSWTTAIRRALSQCSFIAR